MITPSSRASRLSQGPSVSLEGGAVIPFAIFGLLGLFVMAGLALDCTNLYRSRVKLQKCADAAALGGIGYTIEHGLADQHEEADAMGLSATDPHRLKKLIETRTDQILTENLLRSGLVRKNCTNADGEAFCSRWDPVAKQVSVDVRADVNLLLLDLFPFQMLGLNSVASLIEVTVGASAERPVANVGLILDMSGSMSCPDDPNDDCSCRGPLSTTFCSGTLKVDRLIEGLISFVDHFDPQSDEFSIVPFNTRAMVVPGEFGNLASELLDREKIACILSGQGINGCSIGALAQPAGNTNVCDAFITSFADMFQRGIIDQKEIAYLFFSDGAPDAMRAMFNDSPGLPDNSMQFPGTKDFTHYSVQWVPTDGAPAYLAPSLLVKSQQLSFGWRSPSPPNPAATPGQSVPMCHHFLGANGNPEERYPPKSSVDYCKVFEGCMPSDGSRVNLGFYLPFSNARYGSDIFCDPADPASREQSWQRQYYHCALSMADLMRSKRGTFFVIGLGADNAVRNEPYQNISDNMRRKDIFLSRIANDYMHAVTQRQEDNAALDPEFAFDGFQSYADLNSAGSARRGEYLSTPSADQLRLLFRRMAKRILLRLVR